MAVTALLIRSTPGELLYQITHDGAAGDTLTLANATLVADAANGPLKDKVLNAVLPAANQANARSQFLGQGVSTGATQGLWQNAAEVDFLPPRAAAMASVPAVDADQDAVTPTKGEYNLTLAAAALICFMRIRYKHSIVG